MSSLRFQGALPRIWTGSPVVAPSAKRQRCAGGPPGMISGMGRRSTKFVRRGKSLDQWLWDLVAPDERRRTIAASIISQMHDHASGEEFDDSTFDARAHTTEFDIAVRAIAGQSTFDAQRYIERLVGLILSAQDERVSLFRAACEQPDPSTDKPFPDNLESAVTSAFEAAESMASKRQAQLLAQEIAAGTVFGALGPHVFGVPQLVRELLADMRFQPEILSAIEQHSDAAAFLFPDLLRHLDETGEPCSFQMAGALAAVARNHPDQIRAIVARLVSTDPNPCSAAAHTLELIGEPVFEVAPDAIGVLLAMTAPAHECRIAAIAALGRITRGRTLAIDRLFQLCDDPDMEARGAAITALGDIACEPERVVPRLIRALDDFDEQGGDYARHTRIACALASFGPAALPALPHLIERLLPAESEHDPECGVHLLDHAILDTIAAMGAAARDALPMLQALATRFNYDRDDPEDALAATIRAITPA
jgi:HEAT repeat protein